LAVNELTQLLVPSGLVSPVSFAKIQIVPEPLVSTSIVCESRVPCVCGGVPDTEAEILQDPTLTAVGELQFPLPEHMFVNGAIPGAVNDASTDTGSANAPVAQRSELATVASAVRSLPFMFLLPATKLFCANPKA